MKIWAQESFPSLLRATAQSAVITVARHLAVALALATPALLRLDPALPDEFAMVIGPVEGVRSQVPWKLRPAQSTGWR
ncbi:hypothetical protein [Kitasatospora sp. NPDC057223]|uniref:hypothetical protein n=1 Tax=Kitasatospora sp. NPDC057223 TaxID=3346055 RepID=UPI003640ADE3